MDPIERKGAPVQIMGSRPGRNLDDVRVRDQDGLTRLLVRGETVKRDQAMGRSNKSTGPKLGIKQGSRLALQRETPSNLPSPSRASGDAVKRVSSSAAIGRQDSHAR
jgi:hypothetical protein